jgi:hypothetical protein
LEIPAEAGLDVSGGSVVENFGPRAVVNRLLLVAVFITFAGVMAGSRLSGAQNSGDRAIDRAQRAVSERITAREGGRGLIVRFNRDARTESKSKTEVRVRGTGQLARNNDGEARNFSYEAVVNSRNADVSDSNYDWRSGWYVLAGGGGGTSASNLTGTYRLDRERSDDPATVEERITRNLPAGRQQRLRNAVQQRLEAPESLAIERRGRTITMASSNAAEISFETDGHEQTSNGRTLRTTATLAGERLVMSTKGDRSLVATLNDDLSTKQAGDGDRFGLTVRSPALYEGALSKVLLLG